MEKKKQRVYTKLIRGNKTGWGEGGGGGDIHKDGEKSDKEM